MINQLGYACINMTLNKEGIFTGRTCRQSTLQEKGISYLSELTIQNCLDFQKILEWNVKNNILLFRMSADIIPWGNKIDITTLPDYKLIVQLLENSGQYIKNNNIRITAHPGPYSLLCSEKPGVVENTIKDLEAHSLVFDLLGLSETPYNKINIHVGATYNDKTATLKRWIQNFKKLSSACRKRLTIENDDKESMYSVQELYDTIYLETGIPIVFDLHHHNFNSGNLTHQEAMKLAASTWPTDIVPVIHVSESKSLHENNNKIRLQAHSDLILSEIVTYDNLVDVMIEAKSKEHAVLCYRSLYQQT